jgi:hypothetical protein
MNLNDLRPANEFAQLYGCKVCCYGPPGSGKTPLLNSASRPLLLACEPGLLSMRGSTIPTYTAFEPKRIDEFFEWVISSNEVNNFDTIGIDSVSEMASIYLIEALKKNKHGMAAYGDMAEAVEKQLRRIYFMKNKHVYAIAKQELIEGSKRPYMPGRYLPVSLPHLFDFILHLDIQNVPGVGQVKAFRCNGDMTTMARARTGNLNDFEPPNLSQLFQKAMS